MKENRAYERLKRLYPTAHWQRIESWTTPGILDINGCQDGVEIWVEAKQVAKPTRETSLIKPTVKKFQVSWEVTRRRAGGRTYVALMVGSEFYLLPGVMLAQLRDGIPYSILQLLKIDPRSLFIR